MGQKLCECKLNERSRTIYLRKIAFGVIVVTAAIFLPISAMAQEEAARKTDKGTIISIDEGKGDITVKIDSGKTLKICDVYHYFGQVSQSLEMSVPGSDFTARLKNFSDFKVGDRVEISYRPGRTELNSFKKIAQKTTSVLKGFKLVKEASFQVVVPEDWKKAAKVPEGFDIGFEKAAREGPFTFFLHFETMPAAGGDPPADTSDMQDQWATLVRSQYSDAKKVAVPPVKTVGRILIDQIYDLTDSGVKLRRRYTYQYVAQGRLAYITQCSAPPPQWDAAAKIFQVMIESLRPTGTGVGPAELSVEAALKDMKDSVPKLAASFPDRWACDIKNITWEKDKDGKAVVTIVVAFQRTDIGKIHTAAKAGLKAMAAGKAGDDLRKSFPEEAKDVEQRDVSDFMKYTGQLWGIACYSLGNCVQSPETIRMIISGPKEKAGALTVAYKDALEILRMDESKPDAVTVAKMHRFE